MSILNKQQREAVLSGDGYVLVLAGAGSGKTKVLTERIAYLIREKNVSPERILAFTFTNKAAGEMRTRVEEKLDVRSLSFWIGTFHATGLRILRREAQHIGFKNNFAIYDEDDSLRMVKKIIKEGNWRLNDYPYASARNKISNWKNKLISPDKAYEDASDYIEEQLAEVYKAYDLSLRGCNAFDFDDLITKTVEVFTANPKIKKRYARQFKYVLVDEFQDTNPIQMVMIDMLSSHSENLFVVGDEDQSIYGWRGAAVENILQFDSIYTNAEIIRLEKNYRSTNTILKAANSVIANNAERKGKVLWSNNGKGRPLQVFFADDEQEEADAVKETVINLIRNGYKRSEIAVLYRTNAQSRALEQSMNRGGLPYQIIGGVRFYERREIKDLLGYLKLINNPADDVNFLRVVNLPRRGIGKVTLEKLKEESGGGNLLPSLRDKNVLKRFSGLQKEKLEKFSTMMAAFELGARKSNAHEVLSEVISKTRYRKYLSKEPQTAQARLENIEELLNETIRFVSDAEESSLANFLEEIALISAVDTMKNEDTVSLMTLHNSKGLEYRVVMITGLEEGLLPHYSSFDSEGELEEERRLFYVGMTRAKELLFVFTSSARMKFGNWQNNMPSRFLDEIPDSLKNEIGNVEREHASDRFLLTVTSNNSVDNEKVLSAGYGRYRKGVTVKHPTFGVGKIKEVEGRNRDLKVTVYFAGHGSKKFLACYAPFTFI
ncbi:MAG: UvrD-helicase domain-containing protein [Candidatus Krumholzibacteriota bacterium]|nr:UvrD-helicase domain-containing protein [Candidatus Krumholzibacteriota bacterium]